MFTTRPSKRDKVGFFNTDSMYDVMDGETQIGALVYQRKHRRSTIDLGGKTYTVERLSDRPDEQGYQIVLRAVTGGEKPRVNPFLLKDADGQALAQAEPLKNDFVVTRGGESFSFRKVKRPYQLFRDGSDQSLGSVGQARFFTSTLHMDLPAEFDPPFQVFLLALLVDKTIQSLDSSS
jgi:hypothetical protein